MMEMKVLTCIECPMGCRIEVDVEKGKAVDVRGNSCQRGKAYAESEVVCPVRVITTTVRAKDGTMVCVKTEQPIKKADIFAVMAKINSLTCKLPIKVGDVIAEDLADGISLVATGDFD